MRAGRLGAAAIGAASGGLSETAGQAVQAAGGTKGEAEAARFAGGMSAPLAGTVAGFVAKPAKLAWNALQRIVGQEATIPKAVEAARQNLADIGQAGQPQTALHALLQKGVEADRQAAQKAADDVMARAHEDAARVARTDAESATRLVDEARTRAEAIKSDAAKRASVLDKASDGKLATAGRVLAQAQPELAKVGQVRELSDIGNEVRQAATTAQSEAIQARNEAYRATVAERDAAVAAKESAGQTVDQTQGMKDLKQELSTKLLNTKAGRTAAKGMAQVTEPGVARGYQQVYDSIINKRVQTGADEAGNPTYQTFKTSFEALDHVRRRLGDAIAGRAEAEGYSAIGKQAAQKMYAQISKIQEEFVGRNAQGVNVQRTLQSDYAEASGELTKFGSKAGKKLTAVDRLDPERFAGDPKGIPKTFFSSQQGVRDLKELTGNPQLVERQAADYAARSMQGMSAKQAQAWVRDNNDWMREIPGLSKRSADYATKLEQIERVNNKLVKRAGAAETEAGVVRKEGATAAEKERQAGIERAGKAAEGSVASQERVLAEGSKAAAATQEERFAAAKKLDTILKSGESPEAVRGLLLNGKPEQTRLAAAHLATQPGGQKVLEDSVRQTLRNMSEGTLQQQWTERVLPMLRDGKMIPPERLQVLQGDVERLLRSYKGKDKLSLVQRHIAAALGSVPGIANNGR